MTERDVLRTAKMLVDLHGDDAVLAAVVRINSMVASADIDGAEVWTRVLAATGALLGICPDESKSPN